MTVELENKMDRKTRLVILNLSQAVLSLQSQISVIHTTLLEKNLVNKDASEDIQEEFEEAVRQLKELNALVRDMRVK